jgi:hypothetical protein
MRFDLDEPLFPPHHALPGLLGALEIDDLEHEWKSTKVDEWCAVARLTSAATSLRTAVNAPTDADIAMVLAVARWNHNARQPRIERAVKAYEAAATRYEGVRVQLADVRRRAFAAPAA